VSGTVFGGRRSKKVKNGSDTFSCPFSCLNSTLHVTVRVTDGRHPSQCGNATFSNSSRTALVALLVDFWFIVGIVPVLRIVAPEAKNSAM